jgi:hypothetical protein
LASQLAKTFGFVDSCKFDHKCRIWRKTDLFTFLVETNSLLTKNIKLDPEEVRFRLTDFYGTVDGMYQTGGSDEELAKMAPHARVFKYLKAATKATNDKYARSDRAEIISDILQSTIDGKRDKSRIAKHKKK